MGDAPQENFEILGALSSFSDLQGVANYCTKVDPYLKSGGGGVAKISQLTKL